MVNMCYQRVYILSRVRCGIKAYICFKGISIVMGKMCYQGVYVLLIVECVPDGKTVTCTIHD